ncbi:MULTISPECIES: DNA mismatch repair endonuclease MutL [unclassified Peribacillus]|uniref:DNA mismatch repair endonuclease MutL n=1 Tax=unclassified Peribacillus TaxID=2675266 RepID=UPI0019138914|nr:MULTISPECIES: DNA mismatch repair endonuclease MutL [unclassified Peribacillus]MBK5459293.1 DNA mismatch repair endonuclease MutL [Peribacillus sp. TH27]MBK5481097.1 DNA mismatch repair endonuclease MutL [Peribacillus sp. TH16]MBK5497479.1 DNA mismatch repair endonuclease MutL [Peribacillus sp. TH14]WMX57380.1 DNA mismatch repair endonuclease MutL [Peribacillus sp. R9-11]
MGKIIQLDEALSNKIAAGEVVERPASVVKELVENAIDANSTIIEIELVEAGLGSIRIVDNGDGILADDIEAAFKRHATSKIKDENDLFRIRTLGFRGEAMPSIASVSRFELKSCTGEGVGTRILLEGGIVKELEASSSRKGTDIMVSDLFYNTPARLKYMKTIHTELGNITDVANRLALSHPDVSIRLSHNEKRILHTNGNGDVRQVLAAIYGMNIAKKMIPIQASSLDFTLSGYIVMPEVTRASRNYISTMINGRFIKNYALVKAILDGYHTLLPIGRFPIALLNIEMDPILVDVNVHPSKMEVRLSKEQELYNLVSETIKSAFKKLSLIPSGYTPSPKLEQVKSEQTTLDLDHVVESGKRVLEEAKKEASLLKNTLIRENQEQKNYQDPVEEIVNIEPIEELVYRSDEQQQMEDTYIPVIPEDERRPYFESAKGYTTYTVEQEEEIEIDESASRIPPMYPIGQMHGTYIFAQNEKGLYIIDQHAAQERIKYEYFKEKVGRVENELQDMLVPITLEFSTDQCIRINEYQHELEKVGVYLEEFGYNAYIVRSHPQWFPKGIEQEILEEMIEQLLSMKKVDIKKLREEAAIMMSCKASIKANRHLRNDEIQALLDELRQTTDPFTCPHGRPIIISYSIYEMEKMFKRVM